MLSHLDAPRGPYRAVHHTLRSMPAGSLSERAESLARTYPEQGVTFDFAGEERPFPLDTAPRVLSASEWSDVERGVVQRVRTREPMITAHVGLGASGSGRIVAPPSRQFGTFEAGNRPA